MALPWLTSQALATSADGRPRTDAEVLAGFTALSRAPIRFHDGRAFRLSSFRGQALLVNFWAHWCENCVAEFASMRQLQRAAGGPAQLAVFLVSQPQFWNQDQAAARQMGLTFPLAVLEEPATPAGTESTAMLMLGSMIGGSARFGLPVCYVVSRSGHIIIAGSGGINWTDLFALSKAAAALHS